ncbi:FISUMP domain-containing protein [Draconibacterium halophilum]|uniref:Uncharacterized protein n=1 Tax=Draconibacterium halophilum TaxID=2706887 RepID=A0A6C0RC74_9BACT|nr:FISUMP domain-containing protein [Draconibacterium halophilum]QIA08258.1 hypothetical protein G0Q07_11270 [Draconibacterium halophilum]
MAEFDVGLAQLQEVCNYFVEAEYPYFEELREAFKLLRTTGCRLQEIFEIERWTIVSGYEVSVQPQKGNQVRYITLSSEFASFLAAIENQYKPFLGRTSGQLEYLFNKINPFGGLFSGDRSIISYIYRYCFIRELNADGLTNAQIASIMGHNSETVVNNYLNAEVTSTIEITQPLPDPPIIDGITYPIISIGSQVFTTEPIKWVDSGGDSYDPGGIPGNNVLFGSLYYEAALQRLIPLIPTGWKLPSISDINEMKTFLGSDFDNSLNFLSDDPTFWSSVSTPRNSTGLSLRGGGYRAYNTSFRYLQRSEFWLEDTPDVNRRAVMEFRNYIYIPDIIASIPSDRWAFTVILIAVV